jgi:peptidylprolyl isomerase
MAGWKGGGHVEIRYRGGAISPEEVIAFLTLTGQAHAVLAEIISRKEVLRGAEGMGISVRDEALQEVADGYRRLRGLYSAREMEAFLSESGLTEEDFEAFCEASALMAAIRGRLATEKRVEEYFVNNRAELDRARISSLVVPDKALAEEILIQVTEEGEDFHAMARRHSQDEATRYAGGYVGVVSRRILPADLAAKVFNAGAGEVLGPFERDKLFQLILVEEVTRAELTEGAREGIKDAIFQEWCAQFLKDGFKVIR